MSGFERLPVNEQIVRLSSKACFNHDKITKQIKQLFHHGIIILKDIRRQVDEQVNNCPVNWEQYVRAAFKNPPIDKKLETSSDKSQFETKTQKKLRQFVTAATAAR